MDNEQNSDTINSYPSGADIESSNGIDLEEANTATSFGLHKKRKIFAFAGLFILIVLFSALVIFAFEKSKKGTKEGVSLISPTLVPTLSPSSLLEPESLVITERPMVTPTIVPTVKPTSKPTIKPSPTPFGFGDPVNEKHVCGGSDYPPLPAEGGVPLFVALFPSGSTAQPESLEGFQWDFENDGIWDSEIVNWQSNRIYTSPGIYKPKYRVRGSGNTWSKVCDYPFEVTVGGKSEYENELIKINTLAVEVTVSKANPSFDFPIYESKNFLGSSSRAFRPGFTVSSKEKFVAVRLQNEGDGYGFFETGYDMREGTAFRVHLYIDLSKPNGTYTGASLVQFTRDGKMQDGPRVTYKITLTE